MVVEKFCGKTKDRYSIIKMQGHYIIELTTRGVIYDFFMFFPSLKDAQIYLDHNMEPYPSLLPEEWKLRSIIDDEYYNDTLPN